MMNDAVSEEPSPSHPDNAETTNLGQRPLGAVMDGLFKGLIFLVFIWVMVGICFIFGVRLWYNDAIHPSFLPIAGCAFAASLSFVLISAFEYVTGQKIDVSFNKIGALKGASGPLVLWCVCFLSIVVGLNLLGLSDAVTSPAESICSHSIYSLLATGGEVKVCSP